MSRFLNAFWILSCLAGCASIPDVEYNYYFAKSDTILNVAQTITCDPSKQSLIIVTTASPPTMTYSADIAHGPQRINIRAIEGNFHTFVDSDATFGFYDDGRLKSINQNTVGQGEAAIKSAVSLATTVVGSGVLGVLESRKAAAKPTEVCAIVDKWGGGGGGTGPGDGGGGTGSGGGPAQTTSSSTPTTSAILHFGSAPSGVSIGMAAQDLTTPDAITGGQTVVSITSSNVTLSGKVNATVNSDDAIEFSKPKAGGGNADGGGGSANKPASVNLTYNSEFDITHVLGESFKITRALASRELYKELNEALQKDNKRLPRIDVSIGHVKELGGRASVANGYLNDDGYTGDYPTVEDGNVGLRLQNTASVEVKIFSDSKPIWRGNVIVPLHRTYTLPIPRSALFGKQNFSLTLSEAGAIQSIDYGKLSGATGALNAAGSIATASAPETTANKAADVKAQADLIAQTQRLVQCQTNPANCK